MMAWKLLFAVISILQFLYICAEHRGIISLDSITFDKVILSADKSLLLGPREDIKPRLTQGL